MTVGGHTFFLHDMHMVEPLSHPILDFDKMQGYCFEWRSPAWQYRNVFGSHELGKSVLPFVLGEAQPVMELACRHALWDFSKTLVAQVIAFLIYFNFYLMVVF